MHVLETGILYANPHPLLVSRQAAFPGLARLANGDIIAIFSIGQAFDAADMRAHVCRSTDNGKSWSAPRLLHDTILNPMESESFKPLALANGSLLATGYVFVRPTPLTPIVDPTTNRLLPLHNKLACSLDNGHSWSRPERILFSEIGLELSGSYIQRASGEIVGAGAPFHLGTEGHEGWLISSRDNGESWQKKSTFFRAGDSSIAPWESRLIDFGGERIGVLFWAYDAANDRNLSNRLALSDDNGETFITIDTGIAAQASGGVALSSNEMLSIHAHREAPVGLHVYRTRLHAGRLERLDTLALFADEQLGQGAARGDPFANLRFGQPSLLPLGQDQFLGCYWQVENGQHVIKTCRIRL